MDKNIITPTICGFALEMLFKDKREYIGEKNGIYTFKNLITNDKDSCYIKGNRIIWRVEECSFMRGNGRWRDNDKDEIITFNMKDDKVTITIKENDFTESKTFKL
jgi:hypothetical protein